MRRFFAAIALATLTLTGCASSGEGAKGSRSSSSRDLLLQEEILDVKAANLYEVVQRLRPRWLIIRGGTQSITPTHTSVLVYEGSVRLGEADVLKSMAPESVSSMRYMSGTEATISLVGTTDQWVAGVIVLTSVASKR